MTHSSGIAADLNRAYSRRLDFGYNHIVILYQSILIVEVKQPTQLPIYILHK